MSIKPTNAQEKVIQELSEKISQIRVEEYEKAVGVLELSKKQSNTLSDKISRAEVNNLIIARPSLPKRPTSRRPKTSTAISEDCAQMPNTASKRRNNRQYITTLAQCVRRGATTWQMKS